MKILRIPLVIVLLIVAGPTFYANALTETILHSLGSSPTDGLNPVAALVQGSDGNFYGTTFLQGGVFRISSSGTYTQLCSCVGLSYAGVVTAISTGQPLRGDAQYWHRVSDQSQRHLHESLLLYRLPERWVRASSRAGAGQ